MNKNNLEPNTNETSGTTFVPAQCTNCGGELTVDPTQDAAVCKYCGTPFIVSKAVQNYNIQHNTYQTNIVNDQRKGAVESILSYASERQDKKQQRLDEERRRNEENAKKNKKTILWVLGWIFIFPVPLTILMLRFKTMNKKIKFGIIAAAWIIYLILVLTNGGGSSRNKPAYTPERSSGIVTTVSEEKTEVTTASEAPVTTTAETTTVAETTAAETEGSAETTVSEFSLADVKKAIENGDYSLVTPEFKETMDAYEAFYDEYIAFMKNYSSGEGDVLSMLNDYADMMDKMDEWSKKIDAIDESTLSVADNAYYLLVTLRIEKKLLGSLV